MPEALLIHSDSEHDPDMLALTGVAIGDPFTYIELPDRRIVAISLLDAPSIEREAGVDEIWLDDELGRGEMVRVGDALAGGADGARSPCGRAGRAEFRHGAAGLSGRPGRLPARRRASS